MKSKIPYIVAGLIVVLLTVAGVLYWKQEQHRRWLWAKIPMSEELARVPEEWDVEMLAKRLAATKKVRDADTFKEAAQKVNLTTVKAGGYQLPETAGPQDLAKIFQRGPTHQKVTFPEGFTAHQMATRLTQNGFSAANDLRTLAYPTGHGSHAIEGHWFPDTYWLALNSSATDIAARLNKRYQEVAKELPQPFPTGYMDKRLTLQEVTVLASLVERETDVPSERALIAGVLLNRLRIRMRLQCDASVQYAIQQAALARGDQSHQIVLRRHYQFPSPYNTYLNYGLPPGAICNPGLASLKAAARPLTTKYLFYVWSPKLKRHRFSETFSGHRHNIALAARER